MGIREKKRGKDLELHSEIKPWASSESNCFLRHILKFLSLPSSLSSSPPAAPNFRNLIFIEKSFILILRLLPLYFSLVILGLYNFCFFYFYILQKLLAIIIVNVYHLSFQFFRTLPISVTLFIKKKKKGKKVSKTKLKFEERWEKIFEFENFFWTKNTLKLLEIFSFIFFFLFLKPLISETPSLFLPFGRLRVWKEQKIFCLTRFQRQRRRFQVLCNNILFLKLKLARFC